MSKIRVLTLALLFAVALLATLGLVANPVAQPQQASPLETRVAALETAVADHSSLTQALATRVSHLEAELGLTSQEEPTTPVVTATTVVSSADWEEVTSATGRFTYKRAPDWI